MNLPYKNLEAYKAVLDHDHVIVTVSGGRTSAYQFLHIIEACGGFPSHCKAVFTNTGHELEETLIFINELSRYSGVKIEIIELDYNSPHFVRVTDFANASRNGEPFKQLYNEMVNRKDGSVGPRDLPNPIKRSCTGNLKMRTIHRYCKDILKWPRFYRTVLGFRGDEAKRVRRKQESDKIGFKKLKNGERRGVEAGVAMFPMFNACVSVDDVMEFWDAMPFDLGIDSASGNCTFCYLKSAWKLKELIKQYPDKAKEWAKYEDPAADRRNKVFRIDRPPMAELIKQVEAGDMSRPATDKQLFCGTCTDF